MLRQLELSNIMADTPKKRIDAIDILRGVVMCIMALDHVRDFFTVEQFTPTDLTRASTQLFLTRFLTHYCAPTFVFLAGTGAFLSLNRGKTKAEASKFLLSRGLWLVFLEFTVVGIGWGGQLYVAVIWALGISMIVLSVLIYLPLPAIAAFGLIMIFGHNTLDHINMTNFTPTERTLWILLHVQGMLHPLSNWEIFLQYPVIPWIGVMATGYSFGTLYKLDAAERKKILLTLGCTAIALFTVMRYFNLYGDPSIWIWQGNVHRTILAFINVQKYPPSLDYLLVTLGPGMIFLALVEGKQNKLTDIFVVYGRVPLFYYILHLYLIHLLAIIAGAIFTISPKTGLDLNWIYPIWIFVVVSLYFPCRWFMKYKHEHKQWWLGYI